MTKICNENGVRIVRPAVECRIPVAVIRRAIEAGESADAVGARYGFTGDKVRKHAVDLGMEFPKPACLPKRIAPPDEDIIAAFEQGLAVREMARQWNISHVAVYKHRNRLTAAGRLKVRPLNATALAAAFRCKPEMLPRFIKSPEQLKLAFMEAAA